MKARIEKNQSESADLKTSSQPDFNFEDWARQVRPQLLASVQKRSVR